ncbi:hypothetical protein ACHAXT_002390 [Thalassiosira profunda]
MAASSSKPRKSGGGGGGRDFSKKRKPDFKGDAPSSNLPANKKRALKAERQSHRKHASSVRSAKEIWNELRKKSNDKATNTKLCAELHEVLKGKCLEVAMQHDASRCVQGVLQFGTEKQRREVVTELCEAGGGKNEKGVVNLAELCKIQYAHFVVLKMIKYCARDPACVKLIVKSLKKQMGKLAVHSVGSRVVELLFATFPTKSVAPLKLELYGPQYALFASASPSVDSNAPALPTLAAFVASNPDKKEATLAHLQSLLQKGLDKSLTGFAYFHALLLDYASVASPNDVRSFLAPALAEHALHLLSTRAGTKVVCECFAYGTVKERKKMLKCLKGYARSSLRHRDAYLAILRVCDVMDDTVLVNKTLLAELHRNPDAEKKDGEEEGGDEETSPILDLVLSDTGSKLFLLMLVSKEEEESTQGDEKKAARWQRYLDPYEREVLHRNPTVTENEEEVPTSKKDEETRRRELSVYLKELLVDVCTKHAGEMLASKPGGKVLQEVCDNYPSEEVFGAIVEACEVVGETDGDDALPMWEHPVGHLTLKHLFLAESKECPDEGDPSLARTFYAKFEKELGEIAQSNRGAFVLSALMKTSVKEEAREALKGSKATISQLARGAKGEKKLAGCGVLLEALEA